jgi:hypothetical protein
MPHGDSILSLMRQVVGEQKWGLGELSPSVALKGGWGPGTDGAYLVRQMGIVTLPDGSTVGVALASVPADGSLATGIANLTAMARWFERHAPSGGGKHC